jgi:hypothetical protein
VRVIDATTGNIDTIVGKDPSSTVGNGDGGPAEKAVSFPLCATIDNQGNLLIGEFVNSRGFIRKVDLKTRIITTIAGSKTGESTADGQSALQTKLSFPIGLKTDSQGNIYFLATGLQKIDAKTGIITRLSGFDGNALSDLAIDKDGNIFISVGTNSLFRYDAKSKKVSAFIENTSQAPQENPGVITTVALDNQGNLFVGSTTFSDSQSNPFITIPKILKVDTKTKAITTIISSNNGVYSGDGGQAKDASLSGEPKIIVDQRGNLFISGNDSRSSYIRQIKLPN